MSIPSCPAEGSRLSLRVSVPPCEVVSPSGFTPAHATAAARAIAASPLRARGQPLQSRRTDAKAPCRATHATAAAVHSKADAAIAVPETETYKIQELHLPIYHALCAAVEDALFDVAYG